MLAEHANLLVCLVCAGKVVGSGFWLFDDIIRMGSYEPKPVVGNVGKRSRYGVSLFTVWSFVLTPLAYVLGWLCLQNFGNWSGGGLGGVGVLIGFSVIVVLLVSVVGLVFGLVGLARVKHGGRKFVLVAVAAVSVNCVPFVLLFLFWCSVLFSLR